MTTKDIAMLKRGISKNQPMVVLSLKEWKKMEKEKMELHLATKAILAGEIALRSGKTRSFEAFLKDLHAKNK